MMQLLKLLSLLPLAVVASPTRHWPTTFSEVTVFEPPSDYNIPRTLYARTLQLPNGDLLATWENYSPEPPNVYFPIYRSTDLGQTWSEFSTVQDTVNGVGLRYQPFLYYLDETIGEFGAGTLLLAGNSIPQNLSFTQIDLYASHNQGRTWEFVSHIARGGEAIPDNGLTPVWEPFLLAHEGKLICYYSDQRDNATYGQKLSHQVSTDLKTWGSVVDDVTYDTYTDRPGMPVVSKLPNGQFMMTYEHGSFFGTSSYSFPVTYKLSYDPEKFEEAEGIQMVVSNGNTPDGSPYNVWTPYGGEDGTIIVSSGGSSSIFINKELGAGSWTEIPSTESTSYTRSLRILQENEDYLLLAGGGVLGGTANNVSVSVMDLKQSC